MVAARTCLTLFLSAALVACSSGGAPTTTGGSSAGSGGGTGTGPPPSSTDCSLRARQAWAKSQLDEWYLFPETLPASLDPAPYPSVQDYLDALTATARGQGKDRFFTYI
ncbi:MAG: S41 family peptidase, partial [Sandaracinobacteroides sp.]